MQIYIIYFIKISQDASLYNIFYKMFITVKLIVSVLMNDVLNILTGII